MLCRSPNTPAFMLLQGNNRAEKRFPLETQQPGVQKETYDGIESFLAAA